MGRTSTKADDKLIKTGIALARAKGLSGFTIRQLCAKSKVNLGMFHYHFTNKNNFDQALLKSIYADMLADININISDSASPKQNVRAVILAIHAFIQKNRVLISSLAGDVLSGNGSIVDFISKNFTVHISILRQQLVRARKLGLLKTDDEFDAMLILVPPVALPQGLLGLLERMPLNMLQNIKVKFVKHKIESGAQKRMDLLLNAVFKD